MRLTSFCVFILLNLIFIGMITYMILLWIHFVSYGRKRRMYDSFSQDNIISPQLEFSIQDVQIRKGFPRIRSKYKPTEEVYAFNPYNDAFWQGNTPSVTTEKPTTTTESPEKIWKRIEKHKMKVIVKLRTYQKENEDIFNKQENRYGVKYKGSKIATGVNANKLLCSLKSAEIRTLRDGDEPFTSEGMSKYFPRATILEGQRFNNCAIVSSSGSLKGSGLGSFIDSHDYVVRFNHAPTKGFEDDVGEKTSLRILNSQVVTKPEFKFWDSPYFRNVSLLIWDPSNYKSTLSQWYAHSDYPVFTEYFRRRLMMPNEDAHLLFPKSVWNLWDVIQKYTHLNIKPNPPSSGFIGLALMLSHCNRVNVLEYVPSIRLSNRCHYWINATNIGCTFGEWHPLASEKLITLLINESNDFDTFYRGVVSINGFPNVICT